MKSAILYDGPSLLDDKPIVVVAVYSDRNTKTGHVVQTYIRIEHYTKDALTNRIDPIELARAKFTTGPFMLTTPAVVGQL